MMRKLEKNEENQKDKDEENNLEENDEKKEVLIVDVGSNVNEDEKKEEEKKEDKNNNKKDVNKSINSSKSRLSKPQPILNVDAGSVNLVNYKVNNDNDKDKYTNKYPVRYYKYYVGNNLSSSYTPKLFILF